MNHISFPSIEQFRSVIKHVKDNANYHKEAVPTLTFTGTVKLHGTNHAVCMSPTGEIYSQSRERITTLSEDNAGSAAWTLNCIEEFKELFAKIIMTRGINDLVKPTDTIQIFGEWCGGNIQKGVGISKLPKMFVVFAIRISETAESDTFFEPQQVKEAVENTSFTSIYSFPQYTLDIDFNFPEQVQAKLIELTDAVEKDCPVARKLLGAAFDGELVGEGIVWTTIYKGKTLRFKVKGEKHSVSKVKTLAAVDIEKLTSIHEFVASVVTEARLNQGLEHVASREAVNMGPFLKWVMSDIFKEESDTMAGNGFTSKEVSGPMSTAIRKWFLAF